VADPAQHLVRVALELHAPPAAVAALAPLQVRVDRRAVHGHARGQAVHDHGRRGTVRFAGGEEAGRGSQTRRSPGEIRAAGRAVRDRCC
jgi:hypothetical protein